MTAPPLTTPPTRTPGQGVKTQAYVELKNGTRSLVNALHVLGDVNSDVARAILTALKALAPVTPDVEEGVGASELKSLLAGAETAKPGPGGAPGAGPLGMVGGGPPRPQAVAGMPFGGGMQSMPGILG